MKQDIPFDVDFARGHFPLLSGGWALFENAGGTLAAKSVIERARAYIAETHVQPGAAYEASARASERMDEGQRLMAAMMNAAPDEVMIGPSTTMNVYLLAQAIRPWFAPGDEIIVTNLDHEANSGAWRRLAEFGVEIREWRFEPDTVALEMEGLEALLSDKTRLVCFTHCSNVTGAINDVAAITRKAHDAGALVCVDGVAYAPHRRIDVKAWDVDFYLCSLYKLYGPHLGLLYGKREHLLAARAQNHFFFAADDIPLKLNPGGPNHELTASLPGIVDYFDALFRHHFGETNLALHDRIGRVFGLIAEHERRIAAPFVEFLGAKPNLRLIGRPGADREPGATTFSFVVEGRKAADFPAALNRHKVAIRNGHFYAYRAIRDLGLDPADGVVRASMVHYNTEDEVARLIRHLDEVL